MIISRTPFRISFFGGGTDYPAWYRQHGGAVLATTINKHCYISCRYLPPFFDHKYRVVYSKIENCQRIDEITHAAVREILRYLTVEPGVELCLHGGAAARRVRPQGCDLQQGGSGATGHPYRATGPARDRGFPGPG